MPVFAGPTAARVPVPGIETTLFESKAVEVTDPFGNRVRFNEDVERDAAARGPS